MATFTVHRAGSGKRDTYDWEEFYWLVDQGGTLVVWRRSEHPPSRVAAYAPTWWYLVTTEEDESS